MNILLRAITTYKKHGIKHLLKKAIPSVKSPKIEHFKSIIPLFKGKTGIEIGGPSGLFLDQGLCPLYKVIGRLDGCNFSTTTIWEGRIENKGDYNFYKDKPGTQYISEASDLNGLSDERYDFLLSSNCLEHVANPLKAIGEWKRVLKKGGIMLVAVPAKEYCFDHKRAVTTFEHLLEDAANGIGEDDLTHLDEILELHDLSMDKPAGSFEQFKARSLDNAHNRALHQHVFDTELLKQIFDHYDIETLRVWQDRNHIILGRKK